LKWIIFFVISVLVANTFLAYIIGVDELGKIMVEPLSMHVGGFTMMIVFSAVFFFIYLWFREQVCLVVCPYGRMQGVLLDKHSIVVAYDHVRGEPRAKYSKEKPQGTGDCIDCLECVRVCPTGIDIRHGTQLECTNCTACIDACNHIMEKTDRPKGLIRYASEYNIVKKRKLRFTPRMMAYTGFLVALITLESFLLATRSDMDVTMIRARGMLFNREVDGRINNLYSVKIVNKTHHDQTVEFRPRTEGIEVKAIVSPLTVKADSLLETEMFIIMPETGIEHQKQELKIDVYCDGKLVQTARANFLGPVTKSQKK
jgi:cytochrome c oxidase accessory protein FixG